MDLSTGLPNVLVRRTDTFVDESRNEKVDKPDKLVFLNMYTQIYIK